MKNDFDISLLLVIQTYISNLHYHNSNNIIKCSNGSTNWRGNILGAINMKTNDITWKIAIWQKLWKRINEFGVTMTEKH
jgi:hypothetical protein